MYGAVPYLMTRSDWIATPRLPWSVSGWTFKPVLHPPRSRPEDKLAVAVGQSDRSGPLALQNK